MVIQEFQTVALLDEVAAKQKPDRRSGMEKSSNNFISKNFFKFS